MIQTVVADYFWLHRQQLGDKLTRLLGLPETILNSRMAEICFDDLALYEQAIASPEAEAMNANVANFINLESMQAFLRMKSRSIWVD